ncbi:MAG: hypothetical protein ACRC3Y_10560 [Romboutsia sp.]|uniref:hypothetical protein n=1 Tax=Romboutsia sp. TaxID=1965302 RepID=UPI003F2B3FC2
MKNLKNNKLLMMGIGSFLVGNALKQMNGVVADHVSCFVVGFSCSIIVVSLIRDYMIKKSV